VPTPTTSIRRVCLRVMRASLRACDRVPRPLSCALQWSRAQRREVIVRPLNRDSDIYGVCALNSCRARTEHVFYLPFRERRRVSGVWIVAFGAIQLSVGAASLAPS
jgi:hypothetical protein